MIGFRLVEALADRERTLWIAALLLYGVGDFVTTIWGISTAGIAEAGPVAGVLMATHGWGVFVWIKAGTFGLCSLVWWALETPGRAAVPLALTVVGGAVTAWNGVVLFSVAIGW